VRHIDSGGLITCSAQLRLKLQMRSASFTSTLHLRRLCTGDMEVPWAFLDITCGGLLCVCGTRGLVGDRYSGGLIGRTICTSSPPRMGNPPDAAANRVAAVDKPYAARAAKPEPEMSRERLDLLLEVEGSEPVSPVICTMEGGTGWFDGFGSQQFNGWDSLLPGMLWKAWVGVESSNARNRKADIGAMVMEGWYESTELIRILLLLSPSDVTVRMSRTDNTNRTVSPEHSPGPQSDQIGERGVASSSFLTKFRAKKKRIVFRI
jgi:hypothetical protein